MNVQVPFKSWGALEDVGRAGCRIREGVGERNQGLDVRLNVGPPILTVTAPSPIGGSDNLVGA